MKTQDTTIEKMLAAGAHFGYSKTRRHPSASPYIIGTKNRTDLFDLSKTSENLAKANKFVASLAKEGKVVLFVGVKPEAREATKNAAISIDMPYALDRWIGGTLTNFPEIKRRTQKLEDLREKKSKGELDMYTKKERLGIDQDIEKLSRYFGGLVSLKKIPDAIVIVDIKKEHIAVAEAKMMGVPVIGIANTDCNLKEVEYAIPANDSSRGSIDFIVSSLAAAYTGGKN